MAFSSELVLAARRLIRQRGFTAASMLTLGVGLGATVAMFAVVHGIVLNPLAYPEASRLVELDHSAPGIGNTGGLIMSPGLYVHYRETNSALEELAVYTSADVTMTGRGEPRRLSVVATTPDLFSTLRVVPAYGRPLTARDADPGGAGAIVLSHGLWSAEFGARPDLIGSTVVLNGIAVEVVGVMPRGFDFPSRDVDAWVPLAIDPATAPLAAFSLDGVARLAPGHDAAAAARELQRLIPGLVERFPGGSGRSVVENARLTAIVTPLRESIVGDVEATLWILLGTVGVVLLLAATNVTNLLIVRAEARRRELALRSALGAGRGRMVQYFAAEGVWLGAGAGLVGLLLAALGLHLVRRYGPADLPRLHELGLSWEVVGVAAGLSALAGLLSGALPLLLRSAELRGALQQGLRTVLGAGRMRGRHALVVVQTAFALVLIIGAGLMVRSFWHLSQVDLGFEPDGVLTFQISLPSSAYPTRDAAVGRHTEALERIAALPGVTAAGATTCLPLCGSWAGNPYERADVQMPEGEIPPIMATRRVSAGYFETVGISVRAGRTLARADHEQRTGAAVINESAATKLWPGEDPIGKRLYHASLPEGSSWYTVVGVVANAPVTDLTSDPAPIAYLPLLHTDVNGPSPAALSYVIRTSVPPSSVVPGVRRLMSELDAALPLARVRSLRQIVTEASAGMAFTMVMLGIAACMALFLGIVGLYSVVSYMVQRRTSEFGLRLAIGARPADLQVGVLRRGGTLIAVGLAVGLVGALWLTRFMESVVFGISTADPLTYLVVTVLLGAVGMAAIYVPARRAASVDPMRSLRVE